MVNIIINDENIDNKEFENLKNSIISVDVKVDNIRKDTKHIINKNTIDFQKMKNEQENLKELINNLIIENKSLKKLVLDIISNQLKQTKEDIPSKVEVNVEEKIDELIKKQENSETKIRVRHKDSDIYEPNEYVSKLWTKLELEDDGTIINHGRKTFKLPITLNELSYFKECDSPKMDYGVFRSLLKEYNISQAIMGKIIYNLREDSFSKIFDKYNHLLNKAKFELGDDGYVRINNVNTFIDLKMVSDWIKIIVNTDKKQYSILNIQQAHTNIDKNYIRIICDSYTNKKLLKLIKDNQVNTEFIENNPSRRKNLIQQGGIL